MYRLLVFTIALHTCCLRADTNAPAAAPDQILLKDYLPRSLFNIPSTRVDKAKYAAIDVHSHDYARTEAGIEKWVQSMERVGLEKTFILSGAIGKRFDDTFERYHRYPDRFEVWCGIDFSGFDQPGYAQRAMAELVRCKAAGATGVGELSDKGRGMGATSNRLGMHIDDPRMDPILEKCADLRLPINIHVGEDKWMYEPMDASNDGLMNAWKWRIAKGEGVLEHDEVVASLERAVKKHPRTIFVACHLANCCSDLNRIGSMLDESPNLFVDISARFAELSPIPRTASGFFSRYQDRIMYGTDMNTEPEMYRVTFRLLETADEHFYPVYFRKYHWPMHAWALPDPVLKKVYRDNALRVVLRRK